MNLYNLKSIMLNKILGCLSKIINNFTLNNGAWCWFQGPRVIRHKGLFDKTYSGWVNKKGDIIISSYDDNTKLTVYNTLHSKLQIDDHSAPSILIRNDGHIMVFYSAHIGDSLYYKISTNPEDIYSWGDEKKVNTNIEGRWKYTYSNPVQLSNENNKIYLFWRGGNGEPTFSTSIDNGESWSTACTLFNVPGQRPYMKVFSNGIDKIFFTFTDGHPNEVKSSNNIYFVYYQNGSFYKADGTFIKKIEDLPLLPIELDVVYNSVSTGIKAWNWDIAIDKLGNPILVYAVFLTLDDHRYRYARWNGKNWDDNEITQAGGSIDKVHEPYYSGGITLDSIDPSITYLSKEINGIHEIEKWTTNDGGFNWSHNSITSNSKMENIRPVVPVNHSSKGPGLIWMYGKYPFYTKYDTVLKVKFML